MTADLQIDWWSPVPGVLALTIDRPERRNVVDHQLLAALAAAIEVEGAGARAVVLRGAGGEAFSAGFDLDLLEGSEKDLEADLAIGRAVDAITGCPAPVIAMIQGHCHGAGVELALTCDVRIASSDLKLSLQAVSLGVVYRYELVSRLVQLAGLGRAADLLLTRPTLDAGRALEWGLVSEVAAPDALEVRTRELADTIAKLPRSAVEGTKASLVLAARNAVAGISMDQVLTWRRKAIASGERRAALAAARKRLGR